ncbi:MAG TPA: zf-HC2 domain-containing protein [Bryobacteraceae bacterium]|jgi:hypothetical protein|nr:zf-HC2 domain-containing protein [Bryobacteraceae bacterium]
MTCEELETSLADFLDGTLTARERTALEAHLSQCAGCQQFKADVTTGLLLAGRAEELVPPPELVTRLAYLAPVGRTRKPHERQGFFSKVTARWIQPLLQPRFAMGMAMTILSFAMLQRCTGIRVQQIQPADLNPVRIVGDLENRGMRLKDRAVKYYENIRFVYDIEVRLREMEEQQATAQNQGRRKPNSNAQPPAGGAPKPGAQAAPGSQKQQ